LPAKVKEKNHTSKENIPKNKKKASGNLVTLAQSDGASQQQRTVIFDLAKI
jgi:hypothetical protein